MRTLGRLLAFSVLMVGCFPSFDDGPSATTSSSGGGSTTTTTPSVSASGTGGGGAGGSTCAPATSWVTTFGPVDDVPPLGSAEIQNLTVINGKVYGVGVANQDLVTSGQPIPPHKPFLFVLDPDSPGPSAEPAFVQLPGEPFPMAGGLVSIAPVQESGIDHLMVALSIYDSLRVFDFQLDSLLASPVAGSTIVDCTGGMVQDGRLASNGTDVVLAAEIGDATTTMSCTAPPSCSVSASKATMVLPLRPSVPCPGSSNLLSDPDEYRSYPRIALGPSVSGASPIFLTVNGGGAVSPPTPITHLAFSGGLENGAVTIPPNATQLGFWSYGVTSSTPIASDEGASVIDMVLDAPAGTRRIAACPWNDTTCLGAAPSANLSVLRDGAPAPGGPLVFGTVDATGIGSRLKCVGATGATTCPFWAMESIQDPSAWEVISADQGGKNGSATAGAYHCNSVVWAGSFDSKDPSSEITIEGQAITGLAQGRYFFVARHPL